MAVSVLFFAFTLKSANNVTELRLQHTPTTTGVYSYYCVVTTSAGVKIEVEEPFHVYGTSRKLSIKMIIPLFLLSLRTIP